MPTWITAVFGWLGNFTPRYSVVLALLSGFLLFAPAPVLAFVGAEGIAHTYRGWIFVVFGFSALLCATYPLEHSGRFLFHWIERKRAPAKMAKCLENLGADQYTILLEYAQSGKHSLPLGSYSGAARDLVKLGVLYCPHEMPSRGLIPYNLTPLAIPFLKPARFQRILSKGTKDR
jgi:Super-infection exclusion protein B